MIGNRQITPSPQSNEEKISFNIFTLSLKQGYQSYFENNYTKAIQYLTLALKNAERAGASKKQLIHIHTLRSTCYTLTHEPIKAGEDTNEALIKEIEIAQNKEFLPLSKTRSYDPVVIEFKKNQDETYSLLHEVAGELDKLKPDYELILATIEKRESTSALSIDSLCFKTAILYANKNYKQAVETLDILSKRSSECSQTQIAHTYFLSGFCHYQKKNYDEAQQNLLLGIEHDREGNALNITSAYSALNHLCITKNKLNKSSSNKLRTQVDDKIQETPNQAKHYALRARDLINTNPIQSLQDLTMALWLQQTQIDTGTEKETCNHLLARQDLYLSLGDIIKARQDHTAALALMHEDEEKAICMSQFEHNCTNVTNNLKIHTEKTAEKKSTRSRIEDLPVLTALEAIKLQLEDEEQALTYFVPENDRIVPVFFEQKDDPHASVSELNRDAMKLIEKKDFSTAIKKLKTILNHTTDKRTIACTHYSLGSCHMAMNQYEIGSKHFYTGFSHDEEGDALNIETAIRVFDRLRTCERALPSTIPHDQRKKITTINYSITKLPYLSRLYLDRADRIFEKCYQQAMNDINLAIWMRKSKIDTATNISLSSYYASRCIVQLTHSHWEEAEQDYALTIALRKTDKTKTVREEFYLNALIEQADLHVKKCAWKIAHQLYERAYNLSPMDALKKKMDNTHLQLEELKNSTLPTHTPTKKLSKKEKKKFQPDDSSSLEKNSESEIKIETSKPRKKIQKPKTEKLLDIPQDAIDIILALKKAGANLSYCVGGFVRDTLLGEKFNDIDITTDASPDVIADTFKADHIKQDRHMSGLFHLEKNDIKFDIRHSTYLANTASTNPLLDDAKKRGLYINALYTNETKKIIAPLKESMICIRKKDLATIEQTALAYEKDPMLIMITIKLASRFKWPLSIEIRNEISVYAKLMHKKSNPDKINSDLLKLLDDNARNNFRLLINLGVMDALFPNMAADLKNKKSEVLQTVQALSNFTDKDLTTLYDQLLQISGNPKREQFDTLVKANLRFFKKPSVQTQASLNTVVKNTPSMEMKK